MSADPQFRGHLVSPVVVTTWRIRSDGEWPEYGFRQVRNGLPGRKNYRLDRHPEVTTDPQREEWVQAMVDRAKAKARAKIEAEWATFHANFGQDWR